MPEVDATIAMARPRDAAALLVYRRAETRYEILMGQRSRSAGFAPGVYVFPGGTQERRDSAAGTSLQLGLDTDPAMAGCHNQRHLYSLAATALRETAEETGLVLASPPARLHYLGRAITPVQSPARFHARFFCIDAGLLRGTIAGDGELTNLGWVHRDNRPVCRMWDVTEFMLDEFHRFIKCGQTGKPLVYYRKNRMLVRRHTLAG